MPECIHCGKRGCMRDVCKECQQDRERSMKKQRASEQPESTREISKRIRKQHRNDHRMKLWVSVYSNASNRGMATEKATEVADVAVIKFNERFGDDR